MLEETGKDKYIYTETSNERQSWISEQNPHHGSEQNEQRGRLCKERLRMDQDVHGPVVVTAKEPIDGSTG